MVVGGGVPMTATASVYHELGFVSLSFSPRAAAAAADGSRKSMCTYTWHFLCGRSMIANDTPTTTEPHTAPYGEQTFSSKILPVRRRYLRINDDSIPCNYTWHHFGGSTNYIVLRCHYNQCSINSPSFVYRFRTTILETVNRD